MSSNEFKNTRGNSYKISNISISIEKEINRLKSQVALFWENEKKYYEDFGLKDGMNLVEFGSGPGFLSEKILELFPNIHIDLVEIDPYLSAYSEEYLSNRFKGRFSVYNTSILDSRLSSNSYDFAIARLLLEHLPDPDLALQEVRRTLKGKGTLICIDNDFGMHIMTYPPSKELSFLYDAYCRAREAEGGNPRIGRTLPNILQKNGYSNINFGIVSAHNITMGDEKFFASEGIGIAAKLVKDGWVSSKKMADISIAWRDIIRNPQHSIVRQLFIAAGTKI